MLKQLQICSRVLMSDPLIRQWELLKIIPRDRKITVKELEQKLNGLGIDVSRRTVERDLERLSIPFCLESDTRSKPYGWRYAPELEAPTIPGLRSGEALMLLLLEANLKNILPVAVADILASQFAAARHYFAKELPDLKLRQWLKKVKIVHPGQPLLAPHWPSEHQRVVYDALLHGLQLEMQYLSATSDLPKHYDSVHLQGLVQYGRVIYLVVTINDYSDLRLLLLHRIKSVSLKQEPLRQIDDFDLDTYINHGGLGFGGNSHEIRLVAKFMDGVGHYLIDTPLSSDQIVDHLDLQTITISATVEETAKLHWWLTQFGPQVEVLEPKELRTLIAKRHRMAFEQYKD
jgi:predicted DNA-binding transcriptional regulator YafY